MAEHHSLSEGNLQKDFLQEGNVQQLITQHIDLWTGAVKDKSSAGRGGGSKRELYGIKKLRELILELAVRGKLVAQDPNDEPASVLLERIAAEKAELVKQGKIKKPKKLPKISEDEKPFELPQGWEWCYLSDVSSYIQRGKGPKYAESGSVRVISQKCIQNTGFDVGVARYIAESSLGSYQSERFLRDSDILWNSTGTGTVGRANVVRDVEDDSLVADSHVTVIRLLNIDSQFMWSFISAPFIQTRIEPNHENSLVSGSTKQVELNTSSVQSLLVPVAPLMEQHRIVAKVDELMALCDLLEQHTESSLDAHQTLVQTLLDTLLQSADAEELEQNWQRLNAHFDLLFTTEQSIDQLKQTILQLAVMGKLVPQDPNDEPASELLKRITAEKEELVKQKKIKKNQNVDSPGKQLLLPSHWLETQVQDFADIRLGSTPSRSEPAYWGGDIPWVSSGEVAGAPILVTSEKITELGFQNSSVSLIPRRSLLMAIIGQGKTRGQSALLDIDACTNQNVAAFVFNENHVIPEYVWIWAQSKYESHRGDGRGGAQPALNGKIVRSFRFPLPPYEEQNRIVKKFNQLMALCDQLKAKLADSKTTQLNLTNALVAQTV